jgi:hypothetical protein
MWRGEQAKKGERGESDKAGMGILKPREKEKGISEGGNANAKMGRVFHETSGRDKRKRKDRNEMKKKQTAPEGTEITVEEVERQIRKLKRERHRGGTECKMKHGCIEPKE